MHDVNNDSALRGLRRKWRRTADMSSIDTAVFPVVADAGVHVTLDEPLDHPSPDRVVAADPQCEAVIGTDFGFNLSPLQSAASSLYEPSIASAFHETDNVVDVGGKSSFMDDCTAVSDQFIRGARFTAVTMPWETPLMRQIFGEEHPGAKLSMPLDWGHAELPMVDSAESGITQPVIPSDGHWKCFQYVRHKTDDTFLQQREKTLTSAIAKWRFLVMLDLSRSEVGRQLGDADDTEVELVLTSVMGVKARTPS